MKNLFLALLVLPTLSFAAPATKEMNDVSRLLINNPEVGATLRKNCLGQLRDVSSSSTKRGVTKWVLSYDISGFCMPVKGKVTIVEDMTPTMSDGAPEYTVDIAINPVTRR